MTGIALTPDGYVFGDAGQTVDVWAFTTSGAARRLTHSSAWYFDPAIAPDGGRVAYVKQDAWGANVYTVLFAGGDERPVTSDSGSRQLLMWLPGARAISDIVLTGGGASAFSQEVTDLGTGLRRVMTTAPGTVVIRWLPDGTALTEEIAGQTLALADSTGHTIRQLPLPDSLGELTGLAASPDDRELAMATSRPGVVRIFAMRIAGGASRHVADLSVAPGVHLVLERWATDGFLYFSRQAGLAQPDLWRLPARGGTLDRFATLPVACSQGTITLTRDAREGACLVYDNRPDLWLVERK
jgi:Tol biopolymer transport system component